MKRVNQYQFYQLGMTVHSLANIKSGIALSDLLIPLYQAQHSLRSLLDDKPRSGTERKSDRVAQYPPSRRSS